MATLKTNTLTGTSTAGSIAVTAEGNSTTTNLQQGLCKAWCNLDGGTVDSNADLTGVRDSFNISSVEDVSTGSVKTTYTNNMGNDDYAGSALARQSSSGDDAFVRFSNVFTTSQTRYVCVDNGGTSRDGETQTMLTHGDLA